MKRYSFDTANRGTCTFSIVGRYVDGRFDVAVECDDYYREWEDVDGGSADDMFADLLEHGVRFETRHSLLANVYIVGEVMLDRESTVEGVVSRVGEMGGDEVSEKLEWRLGTLDVTE